MPGGIACGGRGRVGAAKGDSLALLRESQIERLRLTKKASREGEGVGRG